MPRFGKFCSRCCLPLLPGFGRNIHATWRTICLAHSCRFLSQILHNMMSAPADRKWRQDDQSPTQQGAAAHSVARSKVWTAPPLTFGREGELSDRQTDNKEMRGERGETHLLTSASCPHFGQEYRQVHTCSYH